MGQKKGILQILNKSGRTTIRQRRHKLCEVKKVQKIKRRISTVFYRKDKKPLNSIDSEIKFSNSPYREKKIIIIIIKKSI